MKPSKKFALIGAGVFLALLLAIIVLVLRSPASSDIDWQTCEQRLPAVIETAGFRVSLAKTEGADSVSLPLSYQLRSFFARKPRNHLTTGFPESVWHLFLENAGARPLQCLVRYTKGQVARIVIRYPADSRANAVRLRDAIQSAFPQESIRLESL